MIEFSSRQFRKVRRLAKFAAVLLRARAEFRRLEAQGPVAIATRVRLLQKWCGDSLASLGIQVEVEGTPPNHGLLLSNHLSYLDILAYSSVTLCAFVSKAEVATWPFFGQYAVYGGTIFIQRQERSAARRGNQEVVEYLRQGVPVVLFPEGTTTDGSHILRFHPSMLQPAIDAAVAVTPCAVAYEVSDGSEKDVAWWGEMTLAPHAWNLVGKKSIRAKVVFGEPLTRSSNRKVMSGAARQRVVDLRTRLVNSRSVESNQ